MTLRTQFRKEYIAWNNMRYRTTNRKATGYENYGGRGIRVCDQWLNLATGFEAFLAYIGPAPSPEHSVDRFPNPNGHYEPGNVKWSTSEEQGMNRAGPSKYGRKFFPKWSVL